MREALRFTLFDALAILILIMIAVAFAVPALNRSRLAANETSAVGALKQIVSTESTWRGTDADGNGIQDYWTLDVAGFHGMTDPTGAMWKFIDVDFARADSSRRVSFQGKPSLNTEVCHPVPKSGYLFRAMLADDGAGSPVPYSVNYVPTRLDRTVLQNRAGAPGYATATNPYLFGFCAAPSAYGKSGVRVFIVCEEGVIHGLDRGCATFLTTWPGTDPTVRIR